MREFGHVGEHGAGLQPFELSGRFSWGVCPRLKWVAPLALGEGAMAAGGLAGSAGCNTGRWLGQSASGLGALQDAIARVGQRE